MSNNVSATSKQTRSSVQDAAEVGANLTQAGVIPVRVNGTTDEARVTMQKFSSLRGYEVAVNLNNGLYIYTLKKKKKRKTYFYFIE